MRRVLLGLVVGLGVAGPAWSQVPPCSTGTTIPVSFSVPEPCPNRPLTLIVASCRPCVDLRGWVAPPGGPIDVFAHMDLPNCMLAICEPDSEAVPIGTFAPGRHSLVVTLRGSVRQPDSTVCSVIQQRTIEFDVPLTCDPPPPPPPCSTEVQVPVTFSVPNACPNRPLTLVATACGPCVDLRGWTRPPGEPFQVNAVMSPSQCVTDVCIPESIETPLGTFVPGQYTVSVRVMGTILGPDSAACSVNQLHFVNFTVPSTCDTVPPPPPCSTNVRIPLTLNVPNPCPGRPLSLVAQACGPCVDLRGFVRPREGPIQLHALMTEAECTNRICNPERVELPIGAFAAGHHEMVVEISGMVLRRDGSLCPSVWRETVSFDVPRQCDSTIVPCPTGTTLPIRFEVPRPCANRPVTLVAEACGPCVDLIGWSRSSAGGLQLRAEMDQRRCMLEICQRESLAFDLGVLAAGHYRYSIEVRGIVTGSNGARCSVIERRVVEFDVPLNCDPIPPGPLPYTDAIQIGPPSPAPICPGNVIPFSIRGRFPTDCIDFRGLELRPNPAAGPTPQPPIARVTIGVNDCLPIPCGLDEVPWSARAAMPGLPAGSYRMIVEMAVVSWCDSSGVDTVYTTIVPFTVARTCSLPPPAACYLYDWRRAADEPCDTHVGPDTPGRLVFQMASPIGIAGVQGSFHLSSPTLRIADLRPVRVAAGMRLVWQPTEGGAKFVLFSERGAPIQSPPCDSAGPCVPLPVPVLEVIVAARPGAPIPERAGLDVDGLIVSDERGRAVPVCPTFARIAPARICKGRSCDWSGDAHVDVRDLVQMVRCVRDSGSCPDSTRGFDCNGDGGMSVDDVMCCARVILHGGAPGDVTPRPAPDLQVRMGTPVVTSAGLTLPVRIDRADLVGAARLVFSYPAGYDVAEAELPGDPTAWLAVSEATGGEMILGLIATGPASETDGSLEVVLRFRSTSGASTIGAVALVDQEFAGHDGALLAPGAANIPTPAPGTRVSLSEAQPNPFTRETRFVLATSHAGDAEVAVFDLSGRRVTTLHRGQLEAGEHPFTWNGTQSDGVRAVDGVYFYRAQVGGATATRKLVLLRGR